MAQGSLLLEVGYTVSRLRTVNYDDVFWHPLDGIAVACAGHFGSEVAFRVEIIQKIFGKAKGCSGDGTGKKR